jgi:leucyl aminopeptidase
MQLALDSTLLLSLATDSVALLVFEKEEGAALQGSLATLVNQASGGWIDEVFARGEFSGKSLETALLHRPSGIAAKRLLLAGAGKPDKFDASEMRKAAGVALRSLKSKGARELALAFDPGLATPALLQAAVEGVLLGDWEPDTLKTDPKKGEKAVERVFFHIPAETPELAAALERGRIIGEAQNFARALVNEPANRLTPSVLADAARQLAAEAGLDCDILDRARMQQLGMGSLLGVAQGSAEPPFLITLRYRPPGTPPLVTEPRPLEAAKELDCRPLADAPGSVTAFAATRMFQNRDREGAAPEILHSFLGGGAHLALIGKGVTFDTGGISIKPSEGMEKMKYDMAGAAAVLGAMKAIAQLRPPVPVSAFCPCVENMPSDRAQRPGDIVKSLNGKTVEVLNTDAEGRLILIDALTYAIREGCTHLVDTATLTGAIVVALGHLHTGLFSNNDAFRDQVAAAGRCAGERLWPMPLDEDYKDYLKSAFADIANIGGRWGGAVTAAKFLEEFVEGKPWAHLDIAGTAWLEDDKPFMAKGPSGVGVRTFCCLIEAIV